MPLSEREQKQLEQLEQATYAEDPQFASRMRGAGKRAAARRRVIIGVVGLLLGLVVLLVGTITTLWIGALGFAMMVASVTVALPAARHTPRPRR